VAELLAHLLKGHHAIFTIETDANISHEILSRAGGDI
jgi:hypothetical protein